MSPIDAAPAGPRRALVTGGASGLGRACARRLRDEHHEVITADVADGAEVRLDVTDDAAVAEIVGQIGPIDILLNSAGVIGPGKPLWETTRAEWEATFAVNVHGTAALCRAVVPGMVSRGWGRIVNFASIAGKDGNPNLSAYSATKAAVINTEMNAATAPDVLAHITSLIPMKRVGQPEEVAELVAWLVSDRCTFSTGAVFDISGGRATY